MYLGEFTQNIENNKTWYINHTSQVIQLVKLLSMSRAEFRSTHYVHYENEFSFKKTSNMLKYIDP